MCIIVITSQPLPQAALAQMALALAAGAAAGAVLEGGGNYQ